MRLRPYVAGLVAILWMAGCVHAPSTAPESQPAPVTSPAAAGPAPAATVPPFRTAAENPKDGPCIQTTHGCIALNPDVDEDTIHKTICVSGYTKTVRPATSYTNEVKRKLMREAGIDPTRIGEYELDHIVPLALGGHPRKPSNLMVQPRDGPHGAHMKDILEERLHQIVCHDRFGLTDAQVCIAQDWEACAAQHPRRTAGRHAR